MQITRTSMTSGITRTQEINISCAEIERYEQGALIQDAFPNLTKNEREFIMTGMTSEEWEELFGKPEEHEENTNTKQED